MMELRYLTADDWKEFREKFPDAHAFLGTCQLREEYRVLTEEREYAAGKRLVWIEARLDELRELQWVIPWYPLFGAREKVGPTDGPQEGHCPSCGGAGEHSRPDGTHEDCASCQGHGYLPNQRVG